MKTDVLIIGGGPGGAAAAMFLLREGITPIILEQEEFPRFHIGESMTGETAAALRRLGLAEKMDALDCPIKHGVRVYGTNSGNSWYVPVAARDENWKLTKGSTWQVRRSTFDAMMLKEAEARGAQVLRGTAFQALKHEDGWLRGIAIRRPDGTEEEIETRVVLDCSGQATFLANQKVTGPKYMGAYDKQIAFYTHVRGAMRDPGDSGEMAEGNTLILYKKKFHWAWFIPVDSEIVSLGLVTPRAEFVARKQTPEEYFRDEIYRINPELVHRLPTLDMVEKVRVIPNYSFQVRGFCGKGFICIGDSHRFIDPIFSFGLSVTIREAEFAAPVVKQYLEGKLNDRENPFAEHQMKCEKGIDNLEDMIDLFWEQPFAFSTFVHVRYTDLITDAFAGRIYEHEHQPSPGILAFRKLLKRTRTYEADDYSVPIGSRYHPERAPLWEPDSPVPGTEDWITSGGGMELVER
ncbi:MAG TPA: FAD-dependent monooxygenase [Chthoniobacterales bacterium]|nr:FAD-dependent monooxygenase [Chthoniobacterales bacterium]